MGDSGQLIYQHHFDRDHEEEIERGIADMSRTLQDYCARNRAIKSDGSTSCPLSDSTILAEIRGQLRATKTLLLKYHEPEEAAKVEFYANWLGTQSVFEATQLLSNNETLGDLVAVVLGDRHRMKDRTEREYHWEKDLKKKWHLPEFEGRHLDFYNTLKTKWERFCFASAYNMYENESDVQCLMTGINYSGKTNMTVCLLAKTNKYLRLHFNAKSDFAKTKPLRRFSMKDDIRYDPTVEELDELLGDRQYNTITLNEAMMAANNLQSMDRKVIALGVTAYITRAKHNMMVYEYQSPYRAPQLMQERFNCWFNKMGPFDAVLSLPSGIMRRKDPLYLKELSQVTGEHAISNWFVRRNPNFCTMLHAPRLKKSAELKIQLYQKEAHEKEMKARKIRGSIGSDYYLTIAAVYEKVHNNEIARVDIPDWLRKVKFSMPQMKRFMGDFDKYEAMKKLEPAEAVGS